MAAKYDVVIIGGGAAGSAPHWSWAERAAGSWSSMPVRRENTPAAHMHGFLSRDGMAPGELLAAGRAEVSRHGVELVPGTVAAVELGFGVRLASGEVLTGRRLLVATGVGDDLPDVPGVRDRWGRDLLHCPYCHGWEVRDQPLGLPAGLPGSVQHGLLIRQWSVDIVFFAHTYELTDEEKRRRRSQGTGTTSAGAGSAAAIAINAGPVEEDVALALHHDRAAAPA